jgi:CRISPR-associated protein Cas5d
MLPSKHNVQLEVAGKGALFTRPDGGSSLVSYPFPTWSAAKSIFESILFFRNRGIYVSPTKVEICRYIDDVGKIYHQNYKFNYSGPLTSKENSQIFSSFLVNPCYRLYGKIYSSYQEDRVNRAHAYKDMFNRRLKQGRCNHTPYMGVKEFVCDYWGPFRLDITEVNTDINITLPSMLYSIWDDPIDGKYNPRFSYNVDIKDGVLEYEQPSLEDLIHVE